MKTIAITGILGYSGRYMAQEAINRGYSVLGLTNSPEKPNPNHYKLAPLNWSNSQALIESLKGCDILINTYWVRFTHKNFSHEEAVKNTKILFAAAQEAGIKRIVHVSITHPDLKSSLPYFKGKAELEEALKQTAIPHTILRPAVLFGEHPGEDILINNMAWSLRKFPFIGVFGSGNYRLQPIHVLDFASLALRGAESKAPHEIIEAVGPEQFTFKELFHTLGEIIGHKRFIIPTPPYLAYLVTKVMGTIQKDIMLTRDEIRGLMEDRLAVDNVPSPAHRKLTTWAKEHAKNLGLHYAHELKRRK